MGEVCASDFEYMSLDINNVAGFHELNKSDSEAG